MLRLVLAGAGVEPLMVFAGVERDDASTQPAVLAWAGRSPPLPSMEDASKNPTNLTGVGGSLPLFDPC